MGEGVGEAGDEGGSAEEGEMEEEEGDLRRKNDFAHAAG